MSDSLQNQRELASGLLFAVLFFPAGIGKITGFADAVGCIASVRMPMPTIAASGAAVVEVGGSLALTSYGAGGFSVYGQRAAR